MNLVFHNVQNAQKDELISILLEQKKPKSHETIIKAKDTIIMIFFASKKPWTSYMKQNLSQ